jgi:hypothetical protein
MTRTTRQALGELGGNAVVACRAHAVTKKLIK